MNYLDTLNEEQLNTVKDTEGYVLCFAGAGSGKTRVLTYRIAYIIDQLNVDPSRILAITFTNKAANEMKQRIENLVGECGVWVSTIHSMCVRILRRSIEKLGYTTNFTIYDEDDKVKVIKKICKGLNIDTNGDFIKDCIGKISNLKNQGVLPEDFINNTYSGTYSNQIGTVYVAYEEKMKKSNSLDFDDLLIKTNVLLASFPDILEYYSKKFEYIHVDEFQDTSEIQYNIIKMLASYHNNLFVVGDDDQGIYSWRGAKVTNIIHFDKAFKNVKVHKLEQNYRSTQEILNCANIVIKNNTVRKDKELWTSNEKGDKPQYFIAENGNEEAKYVVNKIYNLISFGYEAKDIAILMRINSLSYPFERNLTASRIPYKVYGGFKFYERKEIKDVLGYLRVIVNNKDDENLLRIINTPRRGIGDTTIDALIASAKQNGTSLFEELLNVDSLPLGNAAKTRLKDFYNMMRLFITNSYEMTISELVEDILSKTDFYTMFSEDNDDNIERKNNIDNLKVEVKLFEEQNQGDSSLSNYLNNVALASDIDNIGEDNKVTIASIHAVKGLEYKVVFFVGLEEGIIPVTRATLEDDELEEERRLVYVAITRAQEKLFITRAKQRIFYGQEQEADESRFLSEMEPLLNCINPHANRQNYTQRGQEYSSSGAYFKSINTESNSSSFSHGNVGTFTGGFKKVEDLKINTSYLKNDGKYAVGQRVKHVKFGEGKVVGVKEGGIAQIVEVEFPNIGKKTFSAKLAPMEILS